MRGQCGDESIQLGFMVAAQVADLHTEHARKLNPHLGVAFVVLAGADGEGDQGFTDRVLAAGTEASILCFAIGAVWVGDLVWDFPESAPIKLGGGFRFRRLCFGEGLEQHCRHVVILSWVSWGRSRH